jgi:hypothetical protein
MGRGLFRAALQNAGVVALVALAPACSRRPADPALNTAAAPPPQETAQEDQGLLNDIPAAVVHGLRKQKNLDVPVFVDGKEVSVLRFGELPTITPIARKEDEYHRARYYRVSDYLKAIGVDLGRVKAVHFADKSNRIASIEGNELRAEKDRFLFDFLQTKTGMPMPAWKTTGLKNMLRIDEIYAMNVFVGTSPWEIAKGYHCYREDEECKPVARFTTNDLMKGTRIYSDGRLLGYVKRRLVSDEAIAGKTAEGDPAYSLDKFMTALGAKTKTAKEILLFAGDELVATATGKEWAADTEKLTFFIVPHAHGKVRVNVPADMQLQRDGVHDRDTQITSVQVFNKKDPRDLPVSSLDEVFDPGRNVGALENALAQAAPGPNRDGE